MMSISSRQMQKTTTEMLIDSFVSCFVDVGMLCCLLQVNYLRSFAMMCACVAKL
jgi:hypothetical protein